jgi:succinate dehydrogenase flavin-adding protein (antitoxin of CptAB toxin-antitoxin module)
MTLKNLNDKNELVNKLNAYNSLKNEVNNELPELLESKKQELINLINEMQSSEPFKEEASEKEKAEITSLLNQLNF